MTTLPPADPAVVSTLTPVWLDLLATPPWVLWVDLSDMGFSEPALHETMAAAVASNPRRNRLRVGLESLKGADEAGILPTIGLFHASPSGAEALGKRLRMLPDALLVGEVAPINSVLGLPMAAEDHVAMLRRLAGAMGRPRSRRGLFALRFTTWNALYLPVLRAAFPEMQRLFVYDEPFEMLRAAVREGLPWLGFVPDEAAAAQILRVRPEEVPASPPPDFFARILASCCQGVLEHFGEGDLIVHARDAERAGEALRDRLGGAPAPVENPSHTPDDDEDDDEDELRPMDVDQVRTIADEVLGACYRQLEERRQSFS